MKRTITAILGAILLLANGQALAAPTPTVGSASLSVMAQVHLDQRPKGMSYRVTRPAAGHEPSARILLVATQAPRAGTESRRA